MAPILLEAICTTTVATRLNFPERLRRWQERPATAWRERDGRFMVARSRYGLLLLWRFRH